MDFPHGEPISVVTRTASGQRDSAGNVTKPVESTVTYTGAFDPAIGFDQQSGQVSSQPQAYLPFNAAVSSSSVLVIRGKRYEVDGEPAPWRNPFTGWSPGVQVPLRRVEH